MSVDLFESLLNDLGKILKIALHPDRNNSCLIKLKSGLKIQLELDNSLEHLVMGCELGVIPGGRFREIFFKEALRANGLSPPRHGTLAYSKQSDSLILFQFFEMDTLTSELLILEFTPFVEKALIWKEAIDKNEIPIISAERSLKGSKMFGL